MLCSSQHLAPPPRRSPGLGSVPPPRYPPGSRAARAASRRLQALPPSPHAAPSPQPARGTRMGHGPATALPPPRGWRSAPHRPSGARPAPAPASAGTRLAAGAGGGGPTPKPRLSASEPHPVPRPTARPLRTRGALWPAAERLAIEARWRVEPFSISLGGEVENVLLDGGRSYPVCIRGASLLLNYCFSPTKASLFLLLGGGGSPVRAGSLSSSPPSLVTGPSQDGGRSAAVLTPGRRESEQDRGCWGGGCSGSPRRRAARTARAPW